MIKYKDLSWFLKLAIIGGIINFVAFVIGFCYGFFGAL